MLAKLSRQEGNSCCVRRNIYQGIIPFLLCHQSIPFPLISKAKWRVNFWASLFRQVLILMSQTRMASARSYCAVTIRSIPGTWFTPNLLQNLTSSYDVSLFPQRKFVISPSIFHVVTLSTAVWTKMYRTVVKFMAEETDADFGFTDSDGCHALHYLARNQRIVDVKSFLKDSIDSIMSLLVGKLG